MAFYRTLYNTIFKRNSIFVGSIFVGAFLFQPVFDSAVTSFYESHNKGKLWKDVKLTIGGGEEEEDDE